MADYFPYKSFCFSMGTTSFRTENFNKTIEEQLILLNEFWSLEENKKEDWTGNNNLQARYYDFMQEKNFVKGMANNKSKDAREKTSGLVDIGLIDEKRKLTEAGKAILNVVLSGDFSSNNLFFISSDSYIYLKQLLKTSYEIDGNTVRPFLVLIHLLNELEFLTFEEYKYLLPLCIGKNETTEILNGIKELRNKNTTIDKIIIKRLMEMPNYRGALNYFISNDVTENLICEIGLNRKSRQYDKPYYALYKILYDVYVNKNKESVTKILDATKNIKIGSLWRNYLFDSIFKIDPLSHLNKTLFDEASDEKDFKRIFFSIMHLFKAKATLSDYFDLNRRYFRTTNVLLFEDGTVKFDIIPKIFFKINKTALYLDAFTPSRLLFEDSELSEISKNLIIDNKVIINEAKKEFKTSISSLKELNKILSDNRYQRFNHLIDTKFTDDKLIELLDHFKARNDTEIRNMTTDNADVPTIFEYVLGILWYKASERQGRILDYLKLHLDADLLPETHADGGDSDIVYEYEKTNYYPKHSLLLEATLSSGTGQRRMEMEPVSRHLGNHLLTTGNLNSYCVFATDNLNINVISDFRSRKNTPFYNTQDYSKYVEGMKIIPLEIDELKRIVADKKLYKELYPIFEKAFNSGLPPHKWYEECIENKI